MDILYIPWINLAYGVAGGMLGSLVGWFKGDDKIRWCLSFAFLGISFTYVYFRYSGNNGWPVHQDIDAFVLLFGGIGLVEGMIFKYYFRDEAKWHWLVLFALIGIIAAVVYQSRNEIVWFVVAGAVFGGVIWFFGNSRLRWAFLFAGISAMVIWALLVAGHVIVSDSFDYRSLIIIMGALLGGIVGWLTLNINTRWILMLAMLGMFAGSLVEYIYRDSGLLPIILSVVVGGLSGIIISEKRWGRALMFMMFGGLFFCSVKLGWDTLQAMDRIWRSLI